MMNKVANHLKKTLASTVLEFFFDEKSAQEVVYVKPEKIREVCQILKRELKFDIMIDLFAVDWMGKKESRFEVDYLFYNTGENYRVQIRVGLLDNEKPQVDSITDLFGAANWAERECYDMFGIHFNNHPNLKRLLLWKEFKGYPLRKDYPVNLRQPIPVLDELLL